MHRREVEEHVRGGEEGTIDGSLESHSWQKYIEAAEEDKRRYEREVSEYAAMQKKLREMEDSQQSSSGNESDSDSDTSAHSGSDWDSSAEEL